MNTMNESTRVSVRSVAGVGVLVISIFFAASVFAAGPNIAYPISELGGCESKAECHAYCDTLSHISECVSFAETHGLMDQDEARDARAFAKLGGTGPGGCTSKDSCETYCENQAHMRQCIAFARDSGVMSVADVAEAEKVAEYLESGGSLPGGCSGERECRVYCENETHVEECMAFALKAGFMTEQEAEIFKKTGGMGPGGCHGSACESYCDNDSHREECVAFALEHNLLSEEDQERMREGMEKAREAIEKAPPEVLSCIEAAIGNDVVARTRSGTGFVSVRLGEVLPQCFREVMGTGEKGPFTPGSSATDCLRKVFGEDFQAKMQNGEIDPSARDDEIRTCMQSQMGKGYLNEQGGWERSEEEKASPESDDSFERSSMPGSPEENYRRDENFKALYGESQQEMEAKMQEQRGLYMREGVPDPTASPMYFRGEDFARPESYEHPPQGTPNPGNFIPYGGPYQSEPQGTIPMPGTVVPSSETGSGAMRAGAAFLANTLSAVLALFGVQ